MKGDQLVILAMVTKGREFGGPVLFYLDEELVFQVRARLDKFQEQYGMFQACSIADRETIDIVTGDKFNPDEVSVFNLTLLDAQEVFLKSVEVADFQMPQGSEQRQMMEQMLDLGLFKKLAEFVLMRDQS